jgi:hypothetical protein
MEMGHGWGGAWDMGACGLNHSRETCHVSKLAYLKPSEKGFLVRVEI